MFLTIKTFNTRRVFPEIACKEQFATIRNFQWQKIMSVPIFWRQSLFNWVYQLNWHWKFWVFFSIVENLTIKLKQRRLWNIILYYACKNYTGWITWITSLTKFVMQPTIHVPHTTKDWEVKQLFHLIIR
jgi:hypothetical protein